MKSLTKIAAKSLTKYGTKGFLSAMLAMQLGMPYAHGADEAEVKLDRAKVDAKKSFRSAKRDVKKAGRKATGQDNTYDDVKDQVKDAGSNLKDEANHQKKKVE